MYEIFVSYSRDDKVLVKPVVQFLAVRGRNVFWDERIEPGEKWTQKIEEALQESATVMVLWCCHSAESEWVSREAEMAESARKELIPVLLCRYPLRAPLDDYQAIDCRDSVRHHCTDTHARDVAPELVISTEDLLETAFDIEPPSDDRLAIIDRTVRWKWLELSETTITGETVSPTISLPLLIVGFVLLTLVIFRPFGTNLPFVAITLINILTALAGSLVTYYGTGIPARRQIRKAPPESQYLGLVLEAVIQLKPEQRTLNVKLK